MSVVLTDDEHIRQLNAQWRDEDKSTDVLSFPLHEPDTPGDLPEDVFALGDIVISVEYAERLVDSGEHQHRVAEELRIEPDELDWTLSDEVEFLFIHGLLHLVGYDHLDAEDEAEMKATERRLWKAGRAD